MSEDPVLRKIQALLDKAHSTEFEAEAASLLAKADDLMVKYSFQDFEFMAADRPNSARPVRNSKPEVRRVSILDSDAVVDHHMINSLGSIFRSSAAHLFVRMGTSNYREATVIGYPADLDFLEMFFLKIKLHMFSNIMFTMQPDRPWIENVARLKNMGYLWDKIHRVMQDHPAYPYRNVNGRPPTALSGKVREYCEQHNIPRNTSPNPEAWREDFVDGYTHMISRRMREMRLATMDSNPNLPALVADKKSEVDELFYEIYPELRPHPADCQCDTCHFIKCHDEKCDRPRCVEFRKASRRPVPKSHYRNRNMEAEAAGRRVAATADLSTGGSLR